MIRCAALMVLMLGVSTSAASAQEPSDDASTLPPITVTPGEGAATDETSSTSSVDPYDLPWSYPGLSEQMFEGLDGAMRGSTSLFDTPYLGTIVTRQDLEERQAVDMFQALEKEVGVAMQRTQRGAAAPFVRGLTGQQVLILVDGVRLNNSTFRAGPNQYFNTIDPGQVERIEVIRGPQSVLYGSDAIGGVINVVTRGARTGSYNYADGSFIQRFSSSDSGSYSRVNVEGFVDRSGVFAGGSYLNLNDLDRGGSTGRQPFTGYHQWAGDVKFNYLVDRTQMLTIAVSHLAQENVPRTDRFAQNRFTVFDPQQRDLAYIRWQGAPYGAVIDSFMVTASYGRQKEGRRERRPFASVLEDVREFDVDTVGLNVVLVTDLAWAGRLTYGVDLYHDDVDSSANRFDVSASPPSFVGPRTPQFPDDSTYDRFGVFLQWDVDLTDRLSALAGVRYSNVEASATVPVGPPLNELPINPSYQDWTGSAGLEYELTPCLRLVGSVAEGFRAPNLDDLVATNTNVNVGVDIPSPNLSPERSTNYETGLKFDTERIHAQSFVFWTDLDDNIGRSPAGAMTFEKENRDARLNGVELAGEVLLPCGWSTYGNFSYVLGQDLVLDEPLSRVPPVQGVVGMRWRDRCRHSWLDIYGWLVRRQDRLAAIDMADSRIPPGGTPGFGTLNMRMGKRLGDHQTVSLNLDNILDKAYRVHGSGVDGLGFTATLGYELFW